MSTYLSSFLTLLVINIMLTGSLSILIGQSGIYSLAHAAVMAMGAYTAGLVSVELGLSFPLSFLCALIGAGLVSAVVAIPTLRVAGDYFIVASLGLQFVVVRTIQNLDITGGPAGLRAIPAATLFGWEIRGGMAYLSFATVVMLLVLMVCWWITYSPFGRVLRATKLQESAAQALGKNTGAVKMRITLLTGVLAGVGGAVYAHYLRFISPDAFEFEFSILLFAMVVIGGQMKILGAVLGPVVILALPELLRLVDLPLGQQSAARQLILGILLIFFMFFRPEGLAGTGRWRPWNFVRTAPPEPSTAPETVAAGGRS